ncbi:PCNA-associated factor-like [Trichoplusia ni]|uniref:PCNA-associated factor n=1 Tax=Trichoplusia ni TaxID=7111 RepID=A0A7E5X545_TRINI|nr:PCNA-associated factor-like [Trichoplusia ni]
MARTKASVGSKVSSGKSSKARCVAAPTPSSSGASGSVDRANRGGGGGNPVCPRETPKWQKPITTFFISKDEPKHVDVEEQDDQDKAAGSSKPRKTNVIESDEEEEVLTERPKNTVLDDTIELEPLTGEDSHKIEEYYPKGNKGKGVGKKTKGKENKRDSKRLREEDDGEHSSKRVKVN